MSAKFNKTIFIVLAMALLISAAAAWGYLIGREPANRLVLSGTLEADEIRVGSKVGGRVASVLVEEGQAVKQGEAIIRFEGRDLEPMRQDAVAAVAQAEANLQKMQSLSRPEEVAEARAEAEAAKSSLELARNGPRPQETEAARAELRATQADYEVARLNLERLEELARSGVASRQDYDNAKGNFDRARARSEAAGQRLDLLLSGTRREEIERAAVQAGRGAQEARRRGRAEGRHRGGAGPTGKGARRASGGGDSGRRA
jgi:multidrug resistance efflux pump